MPISARQQKAGEDEAGAAVPSRAAVTNSPISNQAVINSLSCTSDARRPIRMFNLAPRFVEYAKSGTYNMPSHDFNSRADDKNDPLRSASTWNSKDFNDAAGLAQKSMLELGGEYSDFSEREIVRLYGENSVPFRDTVLKGSHIWEPSNQQNASVQYVGFENADAAKSSVVSLIDALDSLPPVGDYDAAKWNPEISGRKAFRGMVTWENFGKPRYLPGLEGEGGTVPIGSIVQNRTFMSTSASPSVATEFMLRQRDGPRVADRAAGRNYEGYDTFNSRRVVAEFSEHSGRNVVPYVPEPQAEILFNVDTPFKLNSVDKSDVGYIAHFTEIDSKELERLRELCNKKTYDLQFGLEPLENNHLSTRDVFGKPRR